MEYNLIGLMFGLAGIILVSIGIYVVTISAVDEYQKAKTELEDLRARLLLAESKLRDLLK